jgi:uncharacterized protein (TIGR02145 family)
MKKNLTLLFAAIALFVMAVSCSKDDSASKLSVTPASISAIVAAENYTIDVTGNVSWTAVANAEWLTLTPSSGEGNGSIAVNVMENTALESRTATITITSDKLAKTVTVTQAGVVATLVVNPAAIDAAANAGSYSITITSNAAWTAATNAEWLTIDPASGDGNGTVTVNVAGNSQTETRTATVTVTVAALTETITVTQEGAPTPPPHAASTNLWFIKDQIWSDAIQLPVCNKADFEETSTNPQCRSHTENGNTAYYYNWPYAAQNAATLCPSPWRVPTKDDFIALDIALGGDGENRGADQSWINTNYITNWGGTYAGCVSRSDVIYVGNRVWYWSSSSYGSSESAYNLTFNTNAGVGPQSYYSKAYGFLVRCVK